MTYDSPAEDVGPNLSFHLATAAPRSNRPRSACIGLTAVLAAMLLGGSVAALKATPPQSKSNGSVASTVASEGKKQPAKPVAESNANPNPQRSPSPDASTAAPYRAVLNQYCVTCHNEKLKTAGLMLDKLDYAHPGPNAEIWEKVVRKVRAGMMPPGGAPRPDFGQRSAGQ